MHAALAADDEPAFSAAMRGFNALQDSSVMTSVRKVRAICRRRSNAFAPNRDWPRWPSARYPTRASGSRTC